MRTTLALVVISAAGSTAFGQSCIWTRPGSSSPIDFNPIVTYDSAGARIIQVSGSGVVRKWTGSTWMSLSSQGILPARNNPTVAFDWTRGRAVLHGGSAGSVLFSDTWEWNGTTWTQVSTNGPSADRTLPLVFDAARSKILLYRPVFDPAAPGETWTWDGAAWTLISSDGPPGRISHALAYDSDRLRVQLYGGVRRVNATTSITLADFWEWNGTAWTRLPDAPVARAEHVMIYDSLRHRTSAYGGRNGPTELTDTWDYNGVSGAWIQRTDAGPTPSTRISMAFDPLRARGVLFTDYPPAETWEWNGNALTTPTLITEQPVNIQVAAGQRATLTVAARSNGALTYRWYREQTALQNGGNISGADTPTLVIDPVSPDDSGHYSVLIDNGCVAIQSREAGLYVTGTPCYANCDNSTTPPVLNVNDFVCFMQRFAAGDTYANCDMSNPPPILNVNDFICFQFRFAEGCP